MNKRLDFITILLGRGLQGVTLIVSIRLMTTLLSTEEAGRYYILLGLTAFFALFLVSPVGNYVNRKTHDWYRDGTISKNLAVVWLYLLAVSVVAFLILLAIRSLAGVGTDVTLIWLIVLVIGSILFNTANVTVITIINMLGNRIWFIAFSILTLWLGLGLSSLFVIKFGARAEYWLAGLIVGQLLIFLPSYWYLIRRLSHLENEPGFSSPCISRVNAMSSPFHFAWPLAITAGLSWVQTQSYRFVLGYVGGLESLGLFAVGFGIATAIMAAFYDIFSLYYYPIFYKQISTADSEGKRLAWNESAVYLFPAAILMAAFIIALGPYLAKLLVAAHFLGAEHFIIWGALSQLAFILGAGFQMLAQAEMRTTWLIRPSITGAVVAVIGVLGLAQWNPQLGSGIALTVAGFAMVLHLALKLHKEVPFSLPWRRIFISIVLSVPLLVVFLVYVNPLIGRPTYVQSITVLAIAGSYLLVVQYLMATRWLKGVAIRRGIS